MVIYLDDMLFLSQTEVELLRWRSLALDLLENLGFLVNYPKSSLTISQMIVSRILAEHNYAAAAAPQGETVKDSEGGSEPSAGGEGISKAASWFILLVAIVY